MQQLAIFKNGQPYANVPCDKGNYINPIYNVTGLPWKVKQAIWNFCGEESAVTSYGETTWDDGKWTWGWKIPAKGKVNRKA